MSNKYTVGVTLINSCFHEDILSNAIPPDSITVSNYSDIKIPFDFVLCRDHLNNVTAMFGSNRWDFNPYRLSANKITVIDFDQMCDSGDNSVTNELVFEVKYILFHLIYSVPAGFTGMLSPGTLINYYGVLRKAAKYCEKISAEGLYFGKKTLKDLFSDKTLFLAFVTEHEKLSFNSKAAALVKHLLYLGESILKFRIHTIADALIKRLDNEQTVVIPQRIYMLIADNLEKDINHIHQNSLRLTDFIKEFRDPFYGISETTQKNRAVGGTKNFRLTMDSAIAQYGLNKLFSGHLSVTNRNNLRSTITKIQYLCKLTLHFYTGMRNQEVQRLFCGSIGKHATSKAVLDELGKEIDAARMVEVVSSTTKFTGRRQDASWIATSEVKNAICILERIHEGLSALVDVNLKDDWLFISSDYIKSSQRTKELPPPCFNLVHKPEWFNELLISEIDFKELVNSDTSRNWLLEDDYQVGKAWPLHSHQFRRSLAFYAANLGFISEASLKNQLKHVSKLMTRYYSRNFEQAATVFGYYNEKSDKHKLPKDHILHEFRTGVPLHTAELLLSDLANDELLFGKTGSYMQRQKERLRKGEVIMAEVRSDTIRRIEKGELAYRETLLGGCTKIGKCDSFMLGDFTSCLTCEGAVIKENKVDTEIENTQKELDIYEVGSGEYQLTKSILDKLQQYKLQRMTRTDS